MHRIVGGVVDRAGRGPDAGVLATFAESQRGTLRAPIAMVDDVLGRAGGERHVERAKDHPPRQVDREGPSDDPA